jgi:hypothetical protein
LAAEKRYGQTQALIVAVFAFFVSLGGEKLNQVAASWYSDQGRAVHVPRLPAKRILTAREVIGRHPLVEDYYNDFLRPRDEDAPIATLKNEYPSLLQNLYFDEIDDVFRYLWSLAEYDAIVTITITVLEHRMFAAHFRCRSLSSCPDTLIPETQSNSENDRAVRIVSRYTIPALLNILEQNPSSWERADRITENLIGAMGVVDYQYTYSAGVQRSLSRSLVILSFLHGRGSQFDSSYIRDLRSFGNNSVPEDGYLRVYAKALANIQDGCFINAAQTIYELRSLTSDPYINDLITMLLLRAGARPFMVSGFLEIEDELFVRESCGHRQKASEWSEYFQEVVGENLEPRGIASFEDDYLFLLRLLLEAQGEPSERLLSLVLSSSTSIAEPDEIRPDINTEEVSSSGESSAQNLSSQDGERLGEADAAGLIERLLLAPNGALPSASDDVDEGDSTELAEIITLRDPPETGSSAVQLAAVDERAMIPAVLAELPHDVLLLLVEGESIFAFVEQVTSAGHEFLRLRLGGFSNLSESHAFCTRLVASGSSCVPVAIR